MVRRPALAVSGLALALAGCGATGVAGAPAPGLPASPGAAPTAGPAPARSVPPQPVPAQPSDSSALAALEAVPVRGRAPRTGYDREQFGPAWTDVDRNGCDTRNDVLARDLTAEVFEPGTRDCVVLAGDLAEPYTPKTVRFQRGEGTSDDVQIDHVVALSDAWQKGAQGWDAATRTAFANDPLNLLAVDGALNMQKGDGDAATWLPPNRGYRCAYVARQVAVKTAYGLWMTQAEKDAIATVLSGCPQEPLPGAAQDPDPVPEPGAVPHPGIAQDQRFDSCREALAAGLGPYARGTDPEYDWYQDGDGDGVACEG